VKTPPSIIVLGLTNINIVKAKQEVVINFVSDLMSFALKKMF